MSDTKWYTSFSEWYKDHADEIAALKAKMAPIAKANNHEADYRTFWDAIAEENTSHGVRREVAKQLGMLNADVDEDA